MAAPSLHVPGFAPLAASYTVNELGDTFAAIALAILVLDRTGSAWGLTALLIASRFVPAFIAPIVTVRAERVRPRTILPGLYVIEAVAFAALAILAGGGFSLGAICALALLDGTIALTARTLARATVASLLSPLDLLRDGNGVLNIAFALASAGGPVLGGIVVAAASPSTALWIDAASFAVIAALIAVRGRGLPVAQADTSGRILATLGRDLRGLASQPFVRALVLAEGAAFVLFFLVAPVEVVLAKATLGAGDTGYGALVGSWGVGLLVGAAAFRRVTAPLRVAVGASTLAIGAGYLGMGLAPGIVVACIAAVVGGAGNGVQWVSVLTAVQEATAPTLQARVIGLLESLAAIAPGIGFVLGGALASLWSARAAFVVTGVGVVIVAAVLDRRIRAGDRSGPHTADESPSPFVRPEDAS